MKLNHKSFINKIVLIGIFYIVSCPSPPSGTECGDKKEIVGGMCECIPNAHPAEDEDYCECDSLYHYDEVSDRCILDTTNYHLNWQFDTLGYHLSQLNDVAIISLDDIWVVGEITMPDPDSSWDNTGKETFNAAHWNGVNWELLHIISETTIGPHPGVDITAIYAFDSSNIWMKSGAGAYIHMDNGVWSTGLMSESRGTTIEILGLATDDIYFAGLNGSMTHYNGISFELMETHTHLPLVNLSCSADGDHIFASGRNDMGESIVLRLEADQWETLFIGTVSDSGSGTIGYIHTAELVSDTLFVATSDKLIKYNIHTRSVAYALENNLNYQQTAITHAVAFAPNDIMFFGVSFRRQVQFNGRSFTFNESLHSYFPNAGMKNVKANNGLIAMVGEVGAGEHGILMLGQKY